MKRDNSITNTPYDQLPWIFRIFMQPAIIVVKGINKALRELNK